MYVHLVNSANRHLYFDEIEQMHRHRHRVFAELMGWRALESPDKLDIDEFDTPNASYLICIDEGGVRGSARMVPTWRANMLQNLFPEYVDGPVPTGPAVWEWTRHAPGAPEFDREINHQARYLLSIAALEFAASRGIDSYIGIVDTKLVPRVTDLGWVVIPLGLPINYGEGSAHGFKMNIRAGHAAELRKRLGRTGPVLIEMPGGVSAERGKIAKRTLELALGGADQTNAQASAAMRALEDLLERN